jgi:hypothetical protein
MAQIFKDVSAESAPAVDTTVSTPEAASSDTSSSTYSATQSAVPSESNAGESAAVAAAPVEKTPQRVSWSRYETLRQEHQQTLSTMNSLQQRLADMESKLAQQVVQADPRASAPKAGESQGDWLQRLLDDGEEVNPKLVEQIRSLEGKLDQMNQAVQTHNQRWQNVEYAQANAEYDQNFSRLQSFCPKWDEERLTTMIAEGVKPRMIVAMYRDVYGDAPAIQAAAPAPQVQRAAPPRIDGPASAAPNPGNEPMSKENYLKWVRGEFANTRH